MRHVLPIMAACFVLAAAWSMGRPDSLRRIRRQVHGITAEVPASVPRVAAVASISAPSDGARSRTAPGGDEYFPVRIEGMALDAETGRLVDAARVRGVGCGVYGQEAFGSPRAGGGFEVRMTGGPRLEGTLLLSGEDYETESVSVALDRPWIVLPSVVLKPIHKRAVTVRGMVVDSVTGLPIDNVHVALHVDGIRRKAGWHWANQTHDGGFQISIAAELGLYGSAWLSVPGYRSVCFRDVPLGSGLVELGARAMESSGGPILPP